MAKKGSKKAKKQGKQKQSGFAWASNFETPPYENATKRELAELLATSYRTRTGTALHASLSSATADVPKAIWKAPVATLVVASAEDSGVESALEGSSVCLYANLAACEALGRPGKDGWKEVMDDAIGLPACIGSGKYESGYTKKLSKQSDGAGIRLEDAQRWTIEKAAIADGKLVSQPVGIAYRFEQWIEESDGFVCRPGGVREAPTMDAKELEEAIAAQGAEVRRLKEAEGKANGDPEVKAAVAELLRLKALQT